jgi:hypothetical protein
LPEVFGFGITTLTPVRARSGQSCSAFGLPLCTRITGTDVVGALSLGSRVAQLAGSSAPRSARTSMSVAWFIVTTSASRPSSTLRACLLDPPCDWLTTRGAPPACFQCAMKAAS